MVAHIVNVFSACGRHVYEAATMRLVDTVPSGMSAEVAEERAYRLRLWTGLSELGGPRGVRPAALRERQLYVGSQGIFFDKQRTARIAPGGVALSLLHTGTTYADELSADGVVYHYPRTKRAPSRDLAEITATKTAGRLSLPLFVITNSLVDASLRDVQLAWVEDWDDSARMFLISFGDAPLALAAKEQPEPFALLEDRLSRKRLVETRYGQAAFKFCVFKRYGARCAVCDVDIPCLLEAAHVVPVSSGGVNDARNGLVLCVLHHRAFDAGLFDIDPDSLEVRVHGGAPDRRGLGITVQDIRHLAAPPHHDALMWVWSGRKAPR